MTTHDEEQLDIIRRLYEKEERQIKEKLAQKKAKLKAAQARIRARISVRNRKRRTRCLILIGSYMEHVTQTDLDLKARLMKGLDGFLERDRDRELFNLASRRRCPNERNVPEPEVLPVDIRLGVVDPRCHVHGVAVARHRAGRFPGFDLQRKVLTLVF